MYMFNTSTPRFWEPPVYEHLIGCVLNTIDLHALVGQINCDIPLKPKPTFKCIQGIRKTLTATT